MIELLSQHQGYGLNGLFRTANAQPGKYDAQSDMTTYALRSDYTLHIRGNHEEHPCDSLLKPETLKLLDILVCRLGDSRESRQVELPLIEFLQLAGHNVSEPNKDAVRRQLKKEGIPLLGALSMTWTEEDGRYAYRTVKLFDEISFRRGRVYACFSEEMASYLLNRPSMSLPLPLLAISGKSLHCYSLGRRCMEHNAANIGREWQTIRVSNLLATCPRIPRPEPDVKWSPSILERNVISRFTTAMNTLKTCGILTWKFNDPVCRNDYEGFLNSIIKFQVTDAVMPAPPVEPKAVSVWSPDDIKRFHQQR